MNTIATPDERSGHRFYEELARWWPLLSPVEEYAEEAEEFARILKTAERDVETVLELGSGGGHNAAHLKRHFRMTLSDLSSRMLAISERINPECEHVPADMRTLRLEKTFDAVFVHDAVGYMTTEEDLAAVMDTAFVHCRPGGVAVFVPDATKETFAPATDCGGSDGPGGEGIRYLEWTYDPDPDDTCVTTEYSFLFREPDGTVGTVAERHLEGMFPCATWLRLLGARGFVPEVVLERTDDERAPRRVFVGRRPDPR